MHKLGAEKGLVGCGGWRSKLEVLPRAATDGIKLGAPEGLGFGSRLFNSMDERIYPGGILGSGKVGGGSGLELER